MIKVETIFNKGKSKENTKLILSFCGLLSTEEAYTVEELIARWAVINPEEIIPSTQSIHSFLEGYVDNHGYYIYGRQFTDEKTGIVYKVHRESVDGRFNYFIVEDDTSEEDEEEDFFEEDEEEDFFEEDEEED